jgi:hypothetical protein
MLLKQSNHAEMVTSAGNICGISLDIYIMYIYIKTVIYCIKAIQAINISKYAKEVVEHKILYKMV